MRKILYLLFVVLFFSGCSKEEKSTVVDWEGNEYKTKNYGGTWWMVENMRTTRTKDGQNIWVSSDEEKYSYTIPYCYFIDDNEKNLKKNGCLYNWAAADQVCPEGWHLPTVADYDALANYLGGVDKYCYDKDPKAIAEAMASEYDWVHSDINGTPGNGAVRYMWGNHYYTNNASGFNATPAGWFSPFDDHDYYQGYSLSAYFWLSDGDVNNANTFSIQYDELYVSKENHDKPYGFSVRCVKNQ